MNRSARRITAALVLAVLAGTTGLVILPQLWREEAEPNQDLPTTSATASLEAGSMRPDAPAIDPFSSAPADLRPAVPLLPGEQRDGPAITAPGPAYAPVTDPKLIEIATAMLRNTHVWFCTASSELTEPARAELTEKLTGLEGDLSGQELVVVGYADTRGLSEPNRKLSGERATAVAEFLRGMGLMVADLQGLGELEGLDDDRDCANQRRVDLWVKVGPAVAPSLACDLPTSKAVALNCK